MASKGSQHCHALGTEDESAEFTGHKYYVLQLRPKSLCQITPKLSSLREILDLCLPFSLMRLILLSRVSSQFSSLCSLASMLHQSSCSLHNAVLCRRKKWCVTPGHTVEIRIDDSSMGYIIDEGSKLGRQSVKASDLLSMASKGNVRNETIYLLNATKP